MHGIVDLSGSRRLLLSASPAAARAWLTKRTREERLSVMEEGLPSAQATPRQTIGGHKLVTDSAATARCTPRESA